MENTVNQKYVKNGKFCVGAIIDEGILVFIRKDPDFLRKQVGEAFHMVCIVVDYIN